MRLAIISGLLAGIVALGSPSASAQPPATITYQGYLTGANGEPVSSTLRISFAIYAGPNGGSPLWTEVHPSVQVTNGIYTVALGSVTPITLGFESPAWLGVTIDTDAEMTPRHALTSVPYAFRARVADDLGTACSDGQVLVYAGASSSWQCSTAAGPAGPQGPTGAQGPQGPQGLQGVPGVQGATGAAGASPFVLNGSDAVFSTGAVGIGPALPGTPAAPDASAALDVASTARGFLPPRMTRVQRDAIVAPATGLLVYQTDDTPGLYIRDGGAWVPVSPPVVNGAQSQNLVFASPAASTGTPAFRALVASDIPTLNQNTTGTAANVTGTVAVANGGTGATSLTANAVVLGNGTSALQAVSPGLSGNVLTSNGTTWVSATPVAIPSLSGNSGKYLTTDGSSASWLTPLTVPSDTRSNTRGGANALGSLTVGSDTPRENVGLGANALRLLVGTYANGSGEFNTAVGANTLYNVNSTSGSYVARSNTAVGAYAGYNLTTGGGNAILGAQAMQNVGGAVNDSVAIGMMALQATSGQQNVAIGAYALYNNPFSGNYNVAVGRSAGASMVSGSNSVFLGYGANTAATTASNQIVIGAGAEGSAANQMVLGGDGSASYRPSLVEVVPGKNNATSLGTASRLWTAVYATNGTIQTSDGRLKTEQRPITGGLETLMRLVPKTYVKHGAVIANGALQAGQDAGIDEAGFVAQEVESVIPSAVVRADDQPTTLLGMRYDQILPYAVRAVQELKADNDELRRELAALRAEIAALRQPRP